MSKTPNPTQDPPQPARPTTPGPGPKPPAAPRPVTPRKEADDAIFAALDEILEDLARPSKPRPPSKPPRKPTNTKPLRAVNQSPARQSPQHAGGPVEPDPEGGRAGGSSPAPGAVSGFSLPQPPRLSFAEGAHRLVGAVVLGDGPARPGQPGPSPRPQPTGPVPHPPPPLYDVLSQIP